MLLWQGLFTFFFALFSSFLFVKAYCECKYKKNTHGSFLPLNLIGAFVWTDAVVFGLFWVIVSIVALLLNDWILFLLTLSLFWLVRSVGETIYWFNQQYSKINRNPIERYPYLVEIFHNDSIWFVWQIYWQCITVIALVFSIYFGTMWIKGL